MRRALLLGVLVGVGALSMTVRALPGLPQQAAAGGQPMVVEVDKLKDNLYLMRGGGGNSAVFITATGVTVVDTKNPGWGQPLLEKIRSVTDKPVTMIINTHTHGDHVSGNVDFPATVEVVTHANTAANMKEMRPAIGSTNPPRNIFKEHNGHGMPKRTFTDRLMLGSGNDRIELRYFGRGHTNGDAWVLFPALRMAHAGDIFSGKNIPLLDSNNGGSATEIGNTLDKAADALASQVDGIISGHSTVMTVADLREYAQFNRDFLADARAAKKAGRTVDEAAKAWKIPAKYAGYAAPAEARLRFNMQIAFDETK
jgi:cyclase